MVDRFLVNRTRRAFLQLGLAVPAAVAALGNTMCASALESSGPRPLGAGESQLLPATPACSDGDDATLAQTEGPYYRRSTPERTSLVAPGDPGTRLVLTGVVVTRECQPVARALLDFWQADGSGAYDNAGYRYRGHQFADEAGRYVLETVVPGLYPGRTRHLHVKVQAPNQAVLTTQLYFPGEARNASDGIFRRELLMTVQDQADGKAAGFNFVLNVS